MPSLDGLSSEIGAAQLLRDGAIGEGLVLREHGDRDDDPIPVALEDEAGAGLARNRCRNPWSRKTGTSCSGLYASANAS